ncbi:MAG: hypothetical protein ABIT01_19565 [Thermoanaerobaculia bacterium]
MRGARGVFAALLVAVLVGCASGNVVTSTGAIRPAKEVQAQDFAADTLKGLSDGYRAAADAHDAIPVCVSSGGPEGCESEAIHAADRETLLSFAESLRSSWRILGAWKTSTSGYSTESVVYPLLKGVPDFLKLAVRLHVLSQAQADALSGFLRPFISVKARAEHRYAALMASERASPLRDAYRTVSRFYGVSHDGIEVTP